MSRLSSIFDDSDADGVLDSGETVDAAYKYLGLGQIVEEASPAAKLSYLNSSGNVTGLDRFSRVSDQKWTNTAGTTIDEYTYAYDRAGNVTDKLNALDAALNDHYIYDRLDRLVEWDEGSPLVQQKTWSLDALGNNLSAGTYNAANEETPTEGSSDYDAAGNMITLQSGNSAIYDAWNRLVEVDNTSGIVERYEYDGAGRRIQIFSDFSGSGSGTTADVQDDYYRGQQVVESDMATAYNLATKTGTAAGGYQYLWSPRYIDAPILRDTLTTNRSGIVTADRVFYLADANYNVTGLLKCNSGTWQVAERYTYTPYGAVTVRYGNDGAGTDWSQRSATAYGNTLLYTGKSFSWNTLLQYSNARYYDPGLERFINRDPLSFDAGDMNLYRYVLNNPLIHTDPTGEDCPGCDLPDWVGANNSPCVLACCAKHDECYHNNGCTWKSWGWNACGAAGGGFFGGWGGIGGGLTIAGWLSPCAQCNNDVMDCIAACALPGNHMAGKPLYYCAKLGKYITIGPQPGGAKPDYPDKKSADKACCT